ncbi:MAG: SH3 domain-containing protein, partial [Thermoclostridium sp.]|nr:SH3 domain-containing protein [Thermoclostridium sp.]
KPFKLKSCPEEKEKKTNRTKSKIYVRKNAHELSFADVLKGLVLKIGKIILLPFVVFWNQKLVFLLLIVCLYLFFTLVPLGRMLFYRRSPDLAQLNDRVLKTAQIWVADQITQLEAMASEYELVRDIQKKMVTETQEQEQQAPEPVKYIVTSKTLNVRKEPGTQADKLLRLEQNMIVEFLNQSTDIDGKTWVYIQTPDGTAGWSNASYLKKVEGELEAYEGE